MADPHTLYPTDERLECDECEGAGEWTEHPPVDDTDLPGPPMAVMCPECGGRGFHVLNEPGAAL